MVMHSRLQNMYCKQQFNVCTYTQFLAARSLWTKSCEARYSIPLAICKHIERSCLHACLTCIGRKCNWRPNTKKYLHCLWPSSLHMELHCNHKQVHVSSPYLALAVCTCVTQTQCLNLLACLIIIVRGCSSGTLFEDGYSEAMMWPNTLSSQKPALQRVIPLSDSP